MIGLLLGAFLFVVAAGALLMMVAGRVPGVLGVAIGTAAFVGGVSLLAVVPAATTVLRCKDCGQISERREGSYVHLRSGKSGRPN